ncbi:MAG: hypothetical protein [Bacteriophage sp.]|jgi:hypothetical protein|nr:MAG: hypothetical protein [Bacteriophage sp.]UVY03410.1 MAG: hypothetical protein [Bacteriophage sp.]UWF79287.1 MAG: hypothetical protein [Bacteriophage sp.]UWF82374.1 MAG: hypothetical protein [Bacteriophage sp.]UWG14974.1 MAG: hypothetical protein [Bacteriophage sp.]
MKNFEKMKSSKQREKYIVNGKRFSSYEEVEDYCEKRNFRITNTTTISRGTFLIDVSSK